LLNLTYYGHGPLKPTTDHEKSKIQKVYEKQIQELDLRRQRSSHYLRAKRWWLQSKCISIDV